MSAGSNPIVKARSAGPVIGRTWRETSVPVSTLTSAAISTDPGPNAASAGGTIVPVTDAGATVTAGRTRAMPLTAPPVMTGSPCGFCQTFAPSVIVANSP